MHRLGIAGSVFEHCGLKVLPDESRIGVFDAERGFRVLVVTSVALWVTKRVQAAKRFEEVQESGVGTVDGNVGYAVSPGTDLHAGLFTQQVGLHAQVVRAAQTAAEVVPGQPPLHLPDAVVRLAVHHAALIVLGQRARQLCDHFGSGEAPTGESAGNFVVSEEVAGDFLVTDAYKQVGDVVGEVVIGLNEDVPLHHRGNYWSDHPPPKRASLSSLRMLGQGGSGQRHEGQDQSKKDTDEAAGQEGA